MFPYKPVKNITIRTVTWEANISGANWDQLFITSLTGLLSNPPCPVLNCLDNLPCSCTHAIQTMDSMDYCEHSKCVPTSKSCFFCFLPTPFHIRPHLPKSGPSLKMPPAVPITRIRPYSVFLYLQFTLLMYLPLYSTHQSHAHIESMFLEMNIC